MEQIKIKRTLVGTGDSVDTGQMVLPKWKLEKLGIAHENDIVELVRLARLSKKAQMDLKGKSDFALTDSQWEEVCQVVEGNCLEYLIRVQVVAINPNGTEDVLNTFFRASGDA